MRDAVRAYRALDYIKEHPDEWNQNIWLQKNGKTCGCFAGRVLLLEGLEPVWVLDQASDGSDFFLADEVLFNGVRRYVPDLAEDLLGERFYWHNLDTEDERAENLFNGRNTIEDLERLVLLIFGERP